MDEPKKAGRPKKVQPEPETVSGETPETIKVEVPEETPTAPVLVAETTLPPFVVERMDEGTTLNAKAHPSVIAGVCEACGTGRYSKGDRQVLEEEWTVVPETQLGRCIHYKGVRIRCSFCPQNAEWGDNVRHRRHKILEIPPGSGRLTITCDDMKCAAKYWDRITGK